MLQKPVLLPLARILFSIHSNICYLRWTGKVLKTFWRRFEDVLARRLEDILKTYDWDEYISLDQDVVLKTSSQSVWIRRIYLSWWKTSWIRLLQTKTKDIFKTSSRRLHQDECLLGSNVVCHPCPSRLASRLTLILIRHLILINSNLIKEKKISLHSWITFKQFCTFSAYIANCSVYLYYNVVSPKQFWTFLCVVTVINCLL